MVNLSYIWYFHICFKIFSLFECDGYAFKSWCTSCSYRLVWLGFRRPLVSKDLWCLKGSLWSKNIALKFDKHWKHEKERVQRYVWSNFV